MKGIPRDQSIRNCLHLRDVTDTTADHVTHKFPAEAVGGTARHMASFYGP